MTFGGLDSLFNPAKRHMDEEKQRLQSTREEVGDASGGKRIDLDSGRVKLGRRRKGVRAGQDAVQSDAEAGDPAAEAASLENSQRPRTRSVAAGSDESAAAQRARQRRRKAGAG